MKRIFYEKQGRRYVPVKEYDSDFLSAFPMGTHLVEVFPGGTTRRYKIDPALAPMIAAGRYAKDVISKRLIAASDLRPQRSPLTKEQRQAWEDLEKSFGDERHLLEWPSACEATEAAVDAMAKEAEKLLAHPTVRAAYEQFLMVCELTKNPTKTELY